MRKKDHIFLCAVNSSSRATSHSLRSQGSFSGSLLFPRAPPSVIDLPSHLSQFHLDVYHVLSEWCQCSNHHRDHYFHFHLPTLNIIIFIISHCRGQKQRDWTNFVLNTRLTTSTQYQQLVSGSLKTLVLIRCNIYTCIFFPNLMFNFRYQPIRLPSLHLLWQ